VYLGIYDFDGDPGELLVCYDRMMGSFPAGMIMFHACVVRDGGITIYDACPTQEAFERFSTGETFEQALAAAGLPRPSIEGRPLHAALGPGGTPVG
jgi:hypothetical protein